MTAPTRLRPDRIDDVPLASPIVGLVGCGSTKRPEPSAARDLYTGNLFRRSSGYVEAVCDEWFVLSAKHGLVTPDTVLEPYDVRLGSGYGAPPIWDWVGRVLDDLTDRFAEDQPLHLVVLAGATYRAMLWRLPDPWTYEVPLEGLGIGEQLAWLKAWEASRPPVEQGVSAGS